MLLIYCLSIFFNCIFTRKSRISDMWQRTCMSWTWSCLHTDTCEDTPRDLIEHWGSGLLVHGDQWLSPNARARGREFAVAVFKMHLFRAVYSPAAALRLYSPHICMFFHCATFTINPQGDYVWISAVTRSHRFFSPHSGHRGRPNRRRAEGDDRQVFTRRLNTSTMPCRLF